MCPAHRGELAAGVVGDLAQQVHVEAGPDRAADDRDGPAEAREHALAGAGDERKPTPFLTTIAAGPGRRCAASAVRRPLTGAAMPAFSAGRRRRPR